MRRMLTLGIVVVALASGCTDGGEQPVAQPSSVAISVDLTHTGTDAVTGGVIWHGWWDGSSRSAVLTEDSEAIWFEHDGVVTRTGVSVPDLTTPWVEFDLALWGALDYTHRDFSELGAAVELWSSPSVRSLIAIRDLVADQRLTEGTTTTEVSGAEFLAAIDETIARRSLVDCTGDAEIQATVTDGVVTEIFFGLHTGAFGRHARVTFEPWEGELPDRPAADQITPSRHRRGDASPSVRQPIACDHDPQEPVVIDRGGCPALPDERSEAQLTVLTRHAETTPAVRARFWLHVAPELGIDELADRLAIHDLAATGMNAQSDAVALGTIGFYDADIDGLPPTPADLHSFVESEANRTMIEGSAVITGIEVDGTWGDIARFSADCAVITPGG